MIAVLPGNAVGSPGKVRSMGIFGKLRELIPPSSRSFHGLYGAFNKFNGDATDRFNSLSRDIAELDRRLDAHDTHIKMLLWEMYRTEGETPQQAKKRFFDTIPKARGALRELQLAQARLLGEFDKLCEEHGLRYCIVFGTLLGAVRHDGFVPWDDDIDLAMMRGDIEKLIDVLQDDDRYRVNVVYDRFVFCRQVRFMRTDPENPCFLDLFLLDYSKKTPKAAYDAMKADREVMISRLCGDESLGFWNYDNPYINAEEPGTDLVAAHFDAAVAAEYAADGMLTYDESEAKSIIIGIDNMDFTSYRRKRGNEDGMYRWYSEPETMFPCTRMTFEGVECSAPNDYEYFLVGPYGDYYSLPDDINTSYAHIDLDGAI